MQDENKKHESRLDDTISSIKKQITSIEGRIIRNNKKRELCCKWLKTEGESTKESFGKIDEEIETYRNSKAEKDAFINEKEKAIDEKDKEVAAIEEEYSELVEKNKKLQRKWNEKSEEIQQSYDECMKEHTKLNNQLKFIKEDKRKVSVQLAQLRQDELIRVQAAGSSSLSKKKKQELNDIHFEVQEKVVIMNRIDSDIDSVVLSLQELEDKYNQSKEAVEKKLNEIRDEMQANCDEADEKKKVMDQIYEERTALRNEVLEAIEEEKKIDEMIFMAEERKKELSWDIDGKTREKERLSYEIERDMGFQAELEKKLEQLEKEKKLEQEKNKE